MVKKVLAISFVIFFAILADLGAEGNPVREFSAAEVYYRFSNSPDPDPNQMLRKNVEAAIYNALSRGSRNPQDLKKNLEVSDIRFEKIEKTQIVFATYKDYVFQFWYSQDPRRFHISPMDYKMWHKPVELHHQKELSASANQASE